VLQCVAVCCSVLQCAFFLLLLAKKSQFQVLQRAAVCCSVLQCATVCCSVLQCVAACCSVLQHVAVLLNAVCILLSANGKKVSIPGVEHDAVCCSALLCVTVRCSALLRVTARCSVLQRVAVRCSVLQRVAVCCSVFMRCAYAVFCSVFQCVAVCCSLLQFVAVGCSLLQCGAVWCSVLQSAYFLLPVAKKCLFQAASVSVRVNVRVCERECVVIAICSISFLDSKGELAVPSSPPPLTPKKPKYAYS